MSRHSWSAGYDRPAAQSSFAGQQIAALRRAVLFVAAFGGILTLFGVAGLLQSMPGFRGQAGETLPGALSAEIFGGFAKADGRLLAAPTPLR